MLEVKQLTVTLKSTRQPLVKNVSFSVGEHETFGLIGESGSGKSMTSKSILRLLNPHAFRVDGSIGWQGREVLAMKPRELAGYRGKQVGMIPQNAMTAFAPMVKLGQQLSLGIPRTDRAKRRAFREQLSETLAAVNLPDADKIWNSYPGELSGGMLQRIMIALTLLQTPQLVIADEITTAVDVASERLILNELEGIKQRGISMLIITHDFGVAARLCDRVAVMRAGQLLEQGETHRVLSDPQHEYTRQLMEASVLFQEEPC